MKREGLCASPSSEWFDLERNGRSNEMSDTKQPMNGSEQEPGIIRYVSDGVESTVQYLPTSLTNTPAVYCGDKVRGPLLLLNSFQV